MNGGFASSGVRGGVEGIRPQVSGHSEGDESEALLADQVGRDGARRDHGNRIEELHGQDGAIGTTMLYNRLIHHLKGPPLTIHQIVVGENGLEV